MKGTTDRVMFLWKTTNELQKRCNSGQFFKYQVKLSSLCILCKYSIYASNLPCVTESDLKGGHSLIDDAFRNFPQSLSLSLV